MTATKILWGQIVTVFLIVLLTTWAATQYVAWELGFQPQLGPAWFYLQGWPVYYPPAIFWWWYFFEAYAPAVFMRGGAIAASGGFVAIAVAIGMSVWRAREAGNVETYGSARWAERGEIAKADGSDERAGRWISLKYECVIPWRITMASTEKRTVSLPPEHAAFIDGLVASGSYASASEVVRAGLRALQERNAAVDRWLREEVAPVYDAMQANPERCGRKMDRCRQRRAWRPSGHHSHPHGRCAVPRGPGRSAAVSGAAA